MSKIRVRFAPSPTGYLHIGGLRMALFDYLIAKHYQGKLIFRLEDTDRSRLVPGAAEKLGEVFHRLGIDFDESPFAGGPKAPYVQSQRQEQGIYQQYSKQLLDSSQAYHCFCSTERLTKLREEQNEKKLPPRYDRLCRNLSQAEIEKKLAAGEGYTIRQAMPLEGEITVHDEIRGNISFKAENLDDHVLIKTDGMPTYQFASVIDDHLMEISHVVRGDEWISSFPKNILLYQAFSWQPPKFIHAPLILNKEGGKLSKRQGDVAVEDFLDKGYLREALLNFCALLGWHPKGEEEIMSIEQIAEEFKIEDIGISPAIFDLEKLDYINGYYIRQKTTDELLELLEPYLKKANLLTKTPDSYINNQTGEKINPEQLKLFINLGRDRLKKLNEIGEIIDFLFIKPRYESELLLWKNFSKAELKNNLKDLTELLAAQTDFDKKHLEKTVIEYITEIKKTNGEFLWPMRVALSGRKASPGPFEIAEALGKQKTLERLRASLEKL
jgi:glutamyl-tRNA synthetase